MKPPPPIAFADALARITSVGAARRLPAEEVTIGHALGRVLASAPLSLVDVPGFANAAMDGFALRLADLAAAPDGLPVQGVRHAGAEGPVALAPGRCLRITTGALLPEGADAVVPLEQAQMSGDRMRPEATPAAGAHIRYAGEDYRLGQAIAEAGTQVDAPIVAAAAASGIACVHVHRAPRVAVVVTGDELRPAGARLEPGQIHDSNGPLLAALLAGEGIAAMPVLHAADRHEAVASALEQACAGADLVLCCGGASVGERDLLPGLLAEAGRLHFWRVSMKPGMPVVFAECGAALVLALPGNPVSVFATFLALVRPALDALQGRTQPRERLRALLDEPVDKRHGRHELRRGLLRCDGAGIVRVRAHPAQGSHQLHGVVQSNGLIHLPADLARVEAGEPVEVDRYGAILSP
ncbi:MAG TPA: gephyrin-like molybdotransferase Glp [Xanthomonadaceae bacterium]|nr:gephyrin-like molybdotransferase Glp [Xanthomonadaceae bacterium]